jgi:hypothetical protein
LRPCFFALAVLVASFCGAVSIGFAQSPEAAFAARDTLLFDLSRAILPNSISRDGETIVEILEAQYCGADSDTGVFLASLQQAGHIRPTSPRLIKSDCGEDISKVAKRLEPSKEVDGLIRINATWQPWAIRLQVGAVSSVGEPGLPTSSLNFLQTFGASVPTDKQEIEVVPSKTETFWMAVGFRSTGLDLCLFDKESDETKCSWPSLSTVAISENSNLGALFGHSFLTRMVSKYADNLSFDVTSKYKAVLQSYNYDDASQSVKIKGTISENPPRYRVGLDISLNPLDMSISDVTTDPLVSENCQNLSGGDLVQCKAHVQFQAVLVRNLLLSQPHRPMHVSTLGHPTNLTVFGRQRSIYFDSKHLSFNSRYVQADLSAVISGAK